MSISTIVEKIDIKGEARNEVTEQVAIEEPLSIFVNGDHAVTLLATPIFRKELALGWLLDEGVIMNPDQIENIVGREGTVQVSTTYAIEKRNFRAFGISRFISSECGLSILKVSEFLDSTDLKFIDSSYSVKAKSLIEMVSRIDEGNLFNSTGGVHVAALFEKECLVAFAEDIGRYNAIDKVIGRGFLDEVDFRNSVLVSSGRQPANMVLKAARIGIPIVASKSAQIRSGIFAAEKTGITLVCFVRNNRMNVYTHRGRVLM